jgi:hypothetical protein
VAFCWETGGSLTGAAVEHTSREEHEEAGTCERKRESFGNLGATSDVGLEAFAGLRCCGAGPRVGISKAMDTL